MEAVYAQDGLDKLGTASAEHALAELPLAACSPSPAAASQSCDDLEQLSRWHEFTLQFQCPALTYEQFMQLEFDEQLGPVTDDEAMADISSSESAEDYETASEADYPYTYLRHPSNADSCVEVGSDIADGAEDCQACLHYQPGLTSSDHTTTDAEQYDQEAAATFAAACKLPALVSRLKGTNELSSDLDTNWDSCSDPEQRTEIRQHNKAVMAADTAALAQIRHYQRKAHNLISPKAFKALIDEIMEGYPAFETTDKAVTALQVAAEDLLVGLLFDAQVVAVKAGRQKVCAQDMLSVWRSRGYRGETKLQWSIIQDWYDTCY